VSTRSWNAGASFAVTGLPQKIHPMVVGFEPIKESISLLDGDPGHFIIEPVTVVAVVYQDGWVLIDSGFNVDVVRDPVERGHYYNYDSYTALLPPGDPLPEKVAEVGLSMADLRGCAISHVHCDHTGGLRLVPPGVPVAFQRAEYEFGATLTPAMGAQCAAVPGDYLREELDIVLLDGDAVLAPGLSAIDTSGHTPGHQSFIVELNGRTIVLACDAADLRRNIEDSIPCGSTMRPQDAGLAKVAIDRLHELDNQDGVEVWPGHDPQWWAWQERIIT